MRVAINLLNKIHRLLPDDQLPIILHCHFGYSIFINIRTIRSSPLSPLYSSSPLIIIRERIASTENFGFGEGF